MGSKKSAARRAKAAKNVSANGDASSSPAGSGPSSPRPSTSNGAGRNPAGGDDPMDVDSELETPAPAAEGLSDEQQAERRKEEGNAAFKKKAYGEAVRLYGEAIKLDPGNAAYLTNRAAALMALKRFAEALGDMQLATSPPLSPNGPAPKSLLRLARCHLGLAQIYQSRATLQQLLQVDPSNVDAQREAAKVERLQRSLENVQAARDRADHPMVLIGLDGLERECEGGLTREWKGWKVEALCGRKRWDDAARLAGDLVRENQSDPEALYYRGLVMYYQGNLQAAVKHCQEALRCDPDFTKARTLLRQSRSLESLKEEGNAAFKRGAHEEAISKYNEAIAVDLETSSIRITLESNKAAALSKLKRWQEAIESCEKVLELDKTHFKALRTRGRVKLAMEDFEGAVHDLEAAYEAVQAGSADAAALKKEIREAKVELKKSKQKDYYKILGVPSDASDVDIKKAFRKQSLVHHPDKGGDENKFKEINTAYAILSDPQKRRQVDQGVDPEDPSSGMNGGFDMDGGIPVNLADLFGGGGGGGGGGFNFGGASTGFGGHPFGGGGFNPFDTARGGGPSHRGRRRGGF